MSGSTDKNVRIWSQESGQLVATLTDHTGAIISVDFSPKGGNFVTVDNCGQMILCASLHGPLFTKSLTGVSPGSYESK